MELIWAGIEAVATAVGTLAAIAAAVVAIKTLLALSQDSADRSRPVVVASFNLPPLGEQQLNLVVSNVGASPARNLRVTFDPSPLVLADDPRPAQLAPYIEQRYSRALPLLRTNFR